MESKKIELKVYGMSGTTCERKLEKKLNKINGIESVMASFIQGSIIVEYTDESCSVNDIKTAIISAGYNLQNPSKIKLTRIVGVITAVLLLIIIFNSLGKILGNRAASTKNNKAVTVLKPEIKDGKQIIKITADANGYSPNLFYVQKNIPVKMLVDGKQITSCNNELLVPLFKIKKKLQSGENIIEFTPKDTKDINFSCWMGMISGVIKVVDNIDAVSSATTSNSAAVKAGSTTTSKSTENSALNQQINAPEVPTHIHTFDCGEDETEPGRESIYGNDLSKIPTSRLVQKAQLIDNIQVLSIRARGSEFDPLILVTSTHTKTKLAINLYYFDYSIGTFNIVDLNTKEIISKFQGKPDTVVFEYYFKKTGGYAIVKDKKTLATIEVVNDLNSADVIAIRAKYIK